MLCVPPLALAIEALLGLLRAAGSESPQALQIHFWTGAAFRTLGLGLTVGLSATALSCVAVISLALQSPRALTEVSGWGALVYALPSPALALGLLTQYVGQAETPWPRPLLLVLALTALHLPLAVRLVADALASQPWQSWLDAARVLGATTPRCIWTVLLPAVWRALMASAALGALAVAFELTLALLLLEAENQTLQPVLNALRTASVAETALATTLLMALSGLLIWAVPLRRNDR